MLETVPGAMREVKAVLAGELPAGQVHEGLVAIRNSLQDTNSAYDATQRFLRPPGAGPM